MVKMCSVPGCRSTRNLRCVPFGDKSRWKQWLTVCPHLLKYNLRQLDNVRICNRHFLPKHINEQGRLTKEAVPCFYLNPSNNEKDKVLEGNICLEISPLIPKEGNIFLEISPILPNEPVNLKVVGPASFPPEIDKTFKCSPTVGGLPVDHSMYCLPSGLNISSKELIVNKAATHVDHMYCGTSLPDHTASCLHKGHNQLITKHLSPNVECDIKAEPITAETVAAFAPVWSSMKETTLDENVALQTDAATEHSATQCSEQQADSLAANIRRNSQKADLENRELLLNSQPVTLDNSDFDNSDKQGYEYVVPADECVHKENPKKSVIFLSPEVYNLFTSKSPLEKEMIESIKDMFSSLKDQFNLPFEFISTKSSQVKKFTRMKHPAKINNPIPALKPTTSVIQSLQSQSTQAPTTSVTQSLQSKATQVPTLESLVAELKESVCTEEGAELQPSTAVMAVETVLNLTCDTSTGSPLQDPLGSNTQIKRVRLSKENCTPNEKMLRNNNNILKKKLRNLNLRYRKLKSKSDTIFAKAKEFIKNYPHLSLEGKLMVDMQIRLARKHPQGVRYSEEEKMFALKLLQISPESYKFMQPLLKLPAMTTMKGFEKNA